MTTEKIQAEAVLVDPAPFEGFAFIASHANATEAIKAAFLKAAKNVNEDGRNAVMVRVLIHVEPKALSLDDDTPLSGGVCDMTPGCESCQ
ncbi:hypothetical protein QTI51_09515 [Variovorax sp. J22G73]|uniref:hypothetical protein n=1 Tax=unclassified Variovorax TaxID=663243 RepID=UPI0025749708|nr:MULTISPECIES: hypothetical protein [unclassified Variovorax]MDM0006463.1 hypothetical protein [Variovorax sp. J22R203]MDM0097514.1 hypothetical protein [Variovorax sp. J22G73]